MNSDTNINLYSSSHYSFLDKITLKKRKEIIEVIKKNVPFTFVNNVLDVGSTQDEENASSNFIVKNLGKFNEYKSISDQKIESNFFTTCVQKSITSDFKKNEIDELKSDLVISNATIEHVGDFNNQIKMCKNIINLSKKFFVISTPNKYYPLDFHTKIPFIHWLPDKIYRSILKKMGLNFFSKEENLNLLSTHHLHKIMKLLNHENYKIQSINLFFIKSNLILIGKK